MSGGQTGVDRAALDMALERGMLCGGWCPKGRMAEDGPIAERYPLKETPLAEYWQRTEWNVRDAGATLVLTYGRPTEGTAMTIEYAKQWRKPCLVVDLEKENDPKKVREWIQKEGIQVLNVAGPRESKIPGIYKATNEFLTKVFMK